MNSEDHPDLDVPLRDGLSAEELFDRNKWGGLTYNDYILLPGYISFEASEVELSVNITRNYKLKVPFVSSPMDTVTETEMAIIMALCGGLGVIHHNCSFEKQVSMVKFVKNFENGFIMNPKCLSPQNKILDVLEIKKKYGFCGIPITGKRQFQIV